MGRRGEARFGAALCANCESKRAALSCADSPRGRVSADTIRAVGFSRLSV